MIFCVDMDTGTEKMDLKIATCPLVEKLNHCAHDYFSTCVKKTYFFTSK